MAVKPTRLSISVAAKAKLDAKRIMPARRFPHLVPAQGGPPRSSLQKLFHMDYADCRPPFLKQAKAFSINPRTMPALVSLHPHHVQAVLALALKWDIVASRGYNNTERLQAVVTPSEIKANLLGTFLDAVILGYLVPMETTYET